MTFSEWLEGAVTDAALLDVFVVLIEKYIDGEITRGGFRAENISVEAEDAAQPSGFVRLTYERRAEGSGGEIYPVPETNTEKDDVFCLGILLYTAYTKESVSLEEADKLLNAVGYGSFPFLAPKPASKSAQSSAICSLIAAMTDLNIETRPDMKACLESVCRSLPGSCTVSLTEKATLDTVQSYTVALSSPVTYIKTQSRYEIRGRSYVPEKLDASFAVPYRPRNDIGLKLLIISDSFHEYGIRPLKTLSERLCVGIDLGTWSSSVSYIDEDGYVRDLMFGEKDYAPTALCFKTAEECVFGDEAVELSETFPSAFANCFKRRIEQGESFTVTAADGSVTVESCFDAAVRYLSFIHGECEKFFGERLENADVVLTVPACYDAGMKTALYTACVRAGFSPSLVTEPEAAAFFFGMRGECEGKVLVFDMGGGTTDICLLNCENGEIKSEYVGGLGQLGGIDLTELAAKKMFADTLLRKRGIDVYGGGNEALRRRNERSISQAAETAKRALTSSDQTTCSAIITDPGTGITGSEVFVCKRAYFENIIKPDIEELKRKLKSALAENRLSPSSVSSIIVTGGAALTPAVRRMVKELFEDGGCKIYYSDRGNIVSAGAAVYANERGTGGGRRQSLSETNYDIGTVTAVPFRGGEVFTPLIKAGEKFSGSELTADFTLNLTEREKREGICRVFLYRRPKGLSHIGSPLDADGGDLIRPIGSLELDALPPEFERVNGIVLFRISLDPQECISAQVFFYNKRTEYEFLCSCAARFVPLSETK